MFRKGQKNTVQAEEEGTNREKAEGMPRRSEKEEDEVLHGVRADIHTVARGGPQTGEGVYFLKETLSCPCWISVKACEEEGASEKNCCML